MPQLMPMNWCFSFIIPFLLIFMMIFIYYGCNKLEDYNINYADYDFNNINWKW